ncbi:Farnesyl diphosphate synthase [Zhongshania aliphaticivorans]|uniref:Farnesyl diphosphate synthase n=1 Tax=Zhongshania aliphaticivorans TaxID=1470434 RepID=A0A5S9MW46_9GAMM|nr:farnesyl diphosphate synthase [Zhongshania aliphaticivorans]CAA0079731.1 Farnesyl diphosphate synthase [Zhongshania aliphaticivorans]CAA0086052.1 Farnesyl diphosphate synthase [Zhongshania aliphaticivorans]
MNGEFSDFLASCQQRVQEVLPARLANIDSEFADADASQQLDTLHSASLYSLLNGGKRVRATLVYATAQALGADIDGLDDIACAIEMIHAYSLVHDDLPAMDNDDLRRGKPTCHIAYDEATAILVGDALQARAFELLANLPSSNADTKLSLIRQLSAAAGPRGMVGGQAIDLASINQELDLSTLQTMHQLKTGALIRVAISMSASWCQASAQQVEQLDQYGKAIGLSFQVQDDIIDIESNTETLGKTQGADQALNKPTFPALLGLDGAKTLASELHQRALSALGDFGNNAEPLRALSHYIIARQH